MKFMLTHLIYGEEQDSESADSIIPSVGRHQAGPAVLPGGGRLIKSHERRALPHASAYRKAVYLVRDGRDVAVSYYDWLLRQGRYEGAFESFLRPFLAGHLDGYGTWHGHVRSWMTSPLAATGGLLLVRYEDVRERPVDELGRISDFLGLNATRAQVHDAVSSNTVERARERWQRQHGLPPGPGIQGIAAVPRGSSEKWKRVFTPEAEKRFEDVAGDVLVDLGYARPGAARPAR